MSFLLKRPTTINQVLLSKLIGEHERYSKQTTLPENLGDGALFSTNPIYYAIRNQANSLGATFTLYDSFGYFACPLLSLREILDSKCIPYKNTTAAIKLLENSRPRFFTSRELRLLEFQSNQILHESAHIIADQYWLLHSPKLLHLDLDRNRILRFALGEAFANTTEILAMVHTQNQETRCLLEMNSYWDYIPSIKEKAEKTIQEIGAKSLACWLMLCFLLSNLCQDKQYSTLRTKMLKLSGISGSGSKETSKILDFFAQEALNLNLEFRRHTAQVFYTSMNIDKNLKSLMNFDFVSALERDSNAFECFTKCTSLLSYTFSK